MCNYCGCRAIPTIAALTEEHERLLEARGELGRAVDHAEYGVAVGYLEEIVAVLGPHDTVEELGLYPALLASPEYAEKVGSMFDDHDAVDEVLSAALETAAVAGPAAADWPAVRAALDRLAEHIHAEEYGLFPAANISVGQEAWEHAERVRASLADPHPHSHHGHPQHPHSHG